jgi:recombination protein RecA
MIDSLDAALAELVKQFGEGVIVPASKLPERKYRRTGSLVLDVALGGGYGHSTIVDLVGKHAAGKTLLFDMAAVTAQREENRPSCLFDFEGTHDPKRFIALGGDPSALAIVRAENFGAKVGPMFLEWVTDMLKVQLQNSMFAVIGLDSTAAMVSKAEYEIKEEKGEEAVGVGYTARGMASQLRQIVGSGLLGRSGSTIMYMSQMRDNIGGRGFRGMPPPDKRTGGRALPFFASTQLEVKRGEVYRADLEHSGMGIPKAEVGHETKVVVRKNKLNAVQGRECGFELYNQGEVVGIDRVAEVFKLAVLTDVIQRSGSSYNIEADDRKIRGEQNCIDFLRNNTHVFSVVEDQVRARLDLIQSENAPNLPEILPSDYHGELAETEQTLTDDE